MSRKELGIDNQVLLAVATQHFAQKGFAGARMDEIARDAGVNKATLYYRIGDKDALYHTVLIQQLDITLANILTATSQVMDPESRLRAHILALANSIDKQPSLASLMMREVAAGAEHICEDALQRMHRIRSSIVTILEDGQRQGLFKAVNYFLIHLQVVGTLMFYAAGAPVRERMADICNDHSCRSPLAEAAESLADMIIQSIRINHEDKS